MPARLTVAPGLTGAISTTPVDAPPALIVTLLEAMLSVSATRPIVPPDTTAEPPLRKLSVFPPASWRKMLPLGADTAFCKASEAASRIRMLPDVAVSVPLAPVAPNVPMLLLALVSV